MSDDSSSSNDIETLRKLLAEANERVETLTNETNLLTNQVSDLEKQLDDKSTEIEVLKHKNEDLASHNSSLSAAVHQQQSASTSNTAGGAPINLDDDEDFNDLVRKTSQSSRSRQNNNNTNNNVDSIDEAMGVANNAGVKEKRGGSRTPSYHPSRADSVDLNFVGENVNNNNIKNSAEQCDPPISIVGDDGVVGLSCNSNGNFDKSLGSAAATIADSETPSLGLYFNNPQLATFIEDQQDGLVPAGENVVMTATEEGGAGGGSGGGSDHDEDDHEPRHKTYAPEEDDDGDDHDPRSKAYDDEEAERPNERRQTLNMESYEAALAAQKAANANDDTDTTMTPEKQGLQMSGDSLLSQQQNHNNNALWSQQYSPSIKGDGGASGASLFSPATSNSNIAGRVGAVRDISIDNNNGSDRPSENEIATLMMENSSVASFSYDYSRAMYAQSSTAMFGEQKSIVVPAKDSEGNEITVTLQPATKNNNKKPETGALEEVPKKKSAATEGEAPATGEKEKEKPAKEKPVGIKYPENTKNIKTQTKIERIQSVAVTASPSDILRVMMNNKDGDVEQKNTTTASTSTSAVEEQQQQTDKQGSSGNGNGIQTTTKTSTTAAAKHVQEHLDRLQGLLNHVNYVVVNNKRNSKNGKNQLEDVTFVQQE